MQKEVTRSWALFIGIGTIMIAHGLQMQLMGIRSVVEDFSVITTGIFMSGYFMGYFLGSNTTPKLVQKVGHIRVFAAFASLASLSALLAAVYVNPVMWTLSRFITGISLVSCYIVTESWCHTIVLVIKLVLEIYPSLSDISAQLDPIGDDSPLVVVNPEPAVKSS